jgi:hypothetical protein
MPRKPKAVAVPILAAELAARAPDVDTRNLAQALLMRLKFPMADILAKVPGSTVPQKADAIGCSRQTYYSWLRGDFRPHGALALKVAKLTGHDYNEVAGLAEGTRV